VSSSRLVASKSVASLVHCQAISVRLFLNAGFVVFLGQLKTALGMLTALFWIARHVASSSHTPVTESIPTLALTVNIDLSTLAYLKWLYGTIPHHHRST
jgi:hypothetical protein